MEEDNIQPLVAFVGNNISKPKLNFTCERKANLYENRGKTPLSGEIPLSTKAPSVHPSRNEITPVLPVPLRESEMNVHHHNFSRSISSISSTSCNSRESDVDAPVVLLQVNESNFLDAGEFDKLKLANYLDFLDDYIRFDVSRTGYSIGVQYEDDFLVGKGGTPCGILVCSGKSRVRLWHNEKAFELEYLPRASCTRPKNCVYRVKIPGERNEIGTIHFQQDLVQIYNAYEKCLSLRRKQGTNNYSIKTEAGDRLASVEIFRGFRGDIMYYGLSILGDATATDKALLIGLTIAMDIRQRESEMRCSLLWVPLFCIIVVGLFSFLPWLYFYDNP